MSRSWKVVAAVLTAGWLAAAVSAAPIPTKADDSPAGKARAALDKKVSLKAESKSLTEVIDMLKEESKADIALDTGTLQQFGIDLVSPTVKCEVKDVKLRDALKAALAAHNLRCGVTADGLVVSTEEGLLGKQLRHRVDLDATDRPLGEVLKGLADKSGANLVFDSRPGKKLIEASVTIKAEDVPVETAVRLAAEIGGYGVVRMGNVLFVTTAERADKLAATADRPLGPANPNPIYPVPVDGFPIPGGGVVPPLVDPLPPAKPVEEKKEEPAKEEKK